MDLKETASKLLAYAKTEWRLLAASISFFLLGASIEPMIPALFKKLIDSGFQEGLKYPIWVVPLVIIGLFLLRGAFNFAGTYAINSATSQIVLVLRTQLMTALLRADAKLFTTVSPGLAVNKIISDPQFASQILGNSIITVVKDATTLFFLIAYLLYLNWQLTLLSFVCMPLLGVSIKLVQKRLSKVGEAQYQSQQRLVNAVDDNARAWRVVRTFDAAEFERKRFESEAIHLRRMTMKQLATSALVTPMTQLVAALGVSIIITLAVWQASQGAATVGEFVSFVTALLMTISPMRHLTDVYQPVNGALIAARGAFELLDTPKEPDEGTRELQNCQGRIDFDRVTVHYEGAPAPALNAMDLHIAPGQTIALVGPSGAGKTTVINTLLRFSHIESGTVSLDGVPINELKLSNLRRQFAVVSQDIVLFDGSVAQNVAYANPLGVDPVRVESCLRAANLWSHVEALPQGIHSPIGANGSMLSGGQRQRLAIARALYRDAPIWIFDEATSSLDSESEQIIQSSINTLQHSKTLIIVAHRLSTIRNADLICVVENGVITEMGRHSDLIKNQDGNYCKMVKMQNINAAIDL